MSYFGFATLLNVEDSQVRVGLGQDMAVLRPLGNGEGEVVDAVFERLSAESRHGRYLAAMPRLPRSMRDALAAVDGRRHVAWLARVEGEAVGIARFIRVGADSAEIAFEVVDDHQGRGLGSALLDAITTVAMVSGVRRLQATVLPPNHRSRHLLHKVGLRFAARSGLLEGEGVLRLMDLPQVNRPAVVRIALASSPVETSWRSTSATPD